MLGEKYHIIRATLLTTMTTTPSPAAILNWFQISQQQQFQCFHDCNHSLCQLFKASNRKSRKNLQNLSNGHLVWNVFYFWWQLNGQHKSEILFCHDDERRRPESYLSPPLIMAGDWPFSNKKKQKRIENKKCYWKQGRVGWLLRYNNFIWTSANVWLSVCKPARP